MTNEINTYKRTLIEGFDLLTELALNLRWSWNHSTDQIWKQLDPDLWELTQNPWVILQTVSTEKLQEMLSNAAFRKLVDDTAESNRQSAEAPGWFQNKYPQSSLTCVAYFSMEYMLTEALPIYSGGLGNVAGDQLKASSDLGIPLVAVGLLYQQGYFRQVIGKDGAQQAFYPYNDPLQLPISPLRKPNGEWLRLEVNLPGYSLWFRAWKVQVGKVMLYLLDTNDAANFPAHRGITSELYGGGSELRLKQELLLGIGGWRLLEQINLKPEVCHLNEGHAAFAVLERAKSYMKETGESFSTALCATRAGNIFTTHTAVPAGFDRFSPTLIQQYLNKYTEDNLGLTLEQLLALGRQNPQDASEPFNMAYLAIRASGSVNGVSRLHGKVSRHIFAPLFPSWPEDDLPIGYVTNGVHAPSWDSALADDLWTSTCGKNRWLEPTENLEKSLRSLSDVTIWQMRNTERAALIDFIRKRAAQQAAALGASPEAMDQTKHLFDSNILTLGFARRFATYKRPNLLLHDPERLLRILTNPHRPVQLILAGKAHPADLPGQAMIKEWNKFIEKNHSHIVFLNDYDVQLTEQLVQGVDVWINTPRRPWEACGTSGMKVLVNGGLNLSELDGWWAEAYTPQVGWALGDGHEHGDDPVWDATEANALYTILENDVIPKFYERNHEGIPIAWTTLIRESMAQLTPRFSANRAVREYTEKHYIPAATAYQQRSSNKAALGKEIVQWQQIITQNWPSVRFTSQKMETKENLHHFEVHVYLNNLDPNSIKVELYAEGLDESAPIHNIMERIAPLAYDPNTFLYRASVPTTRPAAHYTPRIVPYFPGVAVPLELGYIHWAH